MDAIMRLRASGPPLLALALALVAAPVLAAGKTQARLPATATSARFALSGSLAPLPSPPAQGGSVQLAARLQAARVDLPVQQGGGLAVIARLAVSPLTCYDDTIFRDGFNEFWP
ncbi:MAG: hypothetical protein KF903_00300 [Dokdonella sp.]|uniref:hypothetical protein n=1 Tax=Dokdonella sp. TaxID=2291710 RepID=UPI0025C0AA6B|nr:hypothetical protein [Dokdonella sp.]MBX3699436.1 hypothetical protein [Dokdonella sp.]